MWLSTAGTYLLVLWGWTAAALQAAFWLLRLGLFAVLVCAAWLGIIEGEQPGRHKHAHHRAGQPSKLQGSSATTSTALSSAALLEHDKASGSSPAAAPAGRRPRSPYAVSELSESIDLNDWSDVGSETDSELDSGDEASAALAAPATPAASAGRPAQAVDPAAAPVAVAVPAVAPQPRPGPVTVSREAVRVPPVQAPVAMPPAATAAAPLPQRKAAAPQRKQAAADAVADEVLPPAMAAVAEDAEEKKARCCCADLAAAALATGAGLAEAGGSAADAVEHGRRHRKKKKKPWLNRKIEGFFKPYADKYSGAGFLIYKGFNRMGKRIERGSASMGHQLDGAIRDAGASGVNEMERVMKRWIQFAGIVGFLAVLLLPLPSVHITIAAG